jgi:hypothetical protein
MKEFFGRYDLLGHPVYENICGRVTITTDENVQYNVNAVENAVDIIFRSVYSVEDTISKLERVRDEMLKLHGGN